MIASRRWRARTWPWPLALVLALSPACKKGAAAKTAPAKVERAPSETELATITLTPEAERRLGIAVAVVENRLVSRVRVVGGETIVPPGRAVAIAAPMAGTLLAPEGGAIAAGTAVRRGQALFRLGSLPPADREQQREASREQAETARISLEAARVKTARAEQLLRDRAGSLKAVQEAQTEEQKQQAALTAAEARVRFLGARDPDALAASLPGALAIEAPRDGVVTDLKVAPGEMVSAGAAVATVTSLDPLWIRVPLYVGDLALVDPRKEVRVHLLGQTPKGTEWVAKAVVGPPVANPAASTADLLFELRNPHGALRPGQRVSVSVALRDQENSLVVPWSAVLFDIEGGTWVYENRAPQVFVRRRIGLAYVVDDVAVLTRGPAPGTKVVSVGAAELFGTEFGAK